MSKCRSFLFVQRELQSHCCHGSCHDAGIESTVIFGPLRCVGWPPIGVAPAVCRSCPDLLESPALPPFHSSSLQTKKADARCRCAAPAVALRCAVSPLPFKRPAPRFPRPPVPRPPSPRALPAEAALRLDRLVGGIGQG